MADLLGFLHYDFVLRGLAAGLIIALVAPLIGMFLVLRRYALIADTLSHVAFTGIAIGVVLGVNPVPTTIATTLLSSVVIERLRSGRRLSGDAALSLFLSGSLALAIVLISARRGVGVNVASYLFGSIVTVTNADIAVIGALGLLVACTVVLLLKELVAISFDEDVAKVGGIPVVRLNTVFIALTALTIAFALPILGVLLISALIVIPVLAALQYRAGFLKTLLIAETVSVAAVLLGMLASLAFNVASGGSIVLAALALFFLSLWVNQR